MLRTLDWQITGPNRTVIHDLHPDESSVVLRWADASTWSVLCPASSPAAAVLALPGHGVAVDLDRTRLIAGPCTSWVLEQGEDGEERVRAEGLDWCGWILTTRQVWPVPAGTIPTATVGTLPAEQHVVPASGTAAAETVVKALVAAHAVNRLPVPGLVLAPDAARGGQVTASARFRPLSEVVWPLCTSGGIGVTCDLDATGRLLFDVTVPVDRSRTILLEREMQNVVAATYSSQPPTFTRCVVAGAGEGAARELIRVIDAAMEAEWPGHVAEGFVDARDVDAGQVGLLQQRGREFLTEHGPRLSVTCVAQDTPQMTYGQDYWLGDLVSALGAAEQVRAVAVEDTPAAGVLVSPTVGPPGGADPLAAVRARFAALTRDIRRLERR